MGDIHHIDFLDGSYFCASGNFISGGNKSKFIKNESLDNNGTSLVLMKNTVDFTQSKQSSSNNFELEPLPRGLAGRVKNSSTSIASKTFMRVLPNGPL